MFAGAAPAAPSLEAAIKPLADGVPQVAVLRLRELLNTKLSAAGRATALAKLAEALVAAGEAEEALTVLRDRGVPRASDTDFIEAQALAALSRWSEAVTLYQQVAADASSPFQAHAVFGHAESLRALRRPDEALLVLAPLTRDARWKVPARFRSVELLMEKGQNAAALRLLDSIAPRSAAERKERRFLRGSIEAKQGNRDRAIDLFASILKRPEGTTHSVLVATLFAIAEVHLQAGRPGAGDDYLDEFIDRHPADRDLPAIFAKLDQLYAAQRRQGRHELGRWANESTQPRRALAQWYLARAELRLGRRDIAVQTFERLRADHPPLPELAEAFVEYAELKLEEQAFDEAIAILEQARAFRSPPAVADRIAFLIGRSHFEAERFDVAAKVFAPAAQPGRPFASAAAFNTSLAWMYAGDTEQAAAGAQDLASRGADDQTQGELLLEQGLVQAREGKAEAAGSLEDFLRKFPKHTRAAEAWVALAELAFHAAPPRLEEAQKHLARAAESQPSAVAAERADYLRIWIEDAAPVPDEPKVTALATEFLQKYPQSPLLADVRMKLAEAYYRRQDFANAQTQFETLAQQNPGAPIAEKAQFFAAQSAMQSMGTGSLDRALVLFDQVVRRNGELKWAARNEQAVIERKLGQPQEAITLYDEVLRGDAKAAEQREALCGKADILYELGAADPENYRRAIELYDQLATQKDVSPHWRNQVLFKKGMSLEKLGQPAEALATFYAIVEDENRPGRPREFFWFYKAGFNAARLLEQEGKWQPAAAIYEKLAFAGGGRSEEAKSRLNRILLEHFLWEQ
jgi:outer membrane protein assembly factor BamD (BamD/ComL family)